MEGVVDARIAPLEPPYAEDVDAMLRKWMPPGAAVDPLLLFRTLAIHDELMARMRPLGAGILGSTVVDPVLRELMIHRTCARCGAEYEWGVHATSFGAAVGLTPEQLRSTVRGGPDDECWTPTQRAVLRLADELHDTSAVSDALYAELASEFDARQLLELVVTAGWYHTIGYVIGLAGLGREPWAARFPS
jgi:4-carboxymuconolactone decarboxylase